MICLSRIQVKTEKLVESIRTKGAKLAIPGIMDLSQLAAENEDVAGIVLESVQELLLRLAFQMVRDGYETRREGQTEGIQLAKAAGKYSGRKPDINVHERIIILRQAGQTIKRTALLSGCSISQVKSIWSMHQLKNAL